MRRWTEEQRRKQAERIRKHAPWEKSTGPKTMEGKARSSMNAWKHGWRSEDGKEWLQILVKQKKFVASVRRGLLIISRREREKRKNLANELIRTPENYP